MGSEERNRLGPVGVGWRKMGTGSRPADCWRPARESEPARCLSPFSAPPPSGTGLLSSIWTSVNATS